MRVKSIGLDRHLDKKRHYSTVPFHLSPESVKMNTFVFAMLFLQLCQCFYFASTDLFIDLPKLLDSLRDREKLGKLWHAVRILNSDVELEASFIFWSNDAFLCVE